MKTYSINKIKNEVQKLVISPSVTEEQAEASMKSLQNFNQCMLGIVYFSGTTPWECHKDDEFLQVVEGKVDVMVLTNEGRINQSLQGGDCFIVPKGLWHRQFSQQGVKVMFITSLEGNQTSTEENPEKR
ncbi:MAG: cupin domain-containing protein [Spirirestis rafaelensis WJT71-NPBG6]|jgi:mannose-6-phosphate isomerase-like protein (cupin superfamily)|nr:cupin domain-containing protein [Spirirestis rafaelensis WJT71-NPBG6]